MEKIIRQAELFYSLGEQRIAMRLLQLVVNAINSAWEEGREATYELTDILKIIQERRWKLTKMFGSVVVFDPITGRALQLTIPNIEAWTEICPGVIGKDCKQTDCNCGNICRFHIIKPL